MVLTTNKLNQSGKHTSRCGEIERPVFSKRSVVEDWRLHKQQPAPNNMKVYVKWYNSIKEGDLLEEEYLISKLKYRQVVINIGGHTVTALYTPKHIYYDERREKSLVS